MEHQRGRSGSGRSSGRAQPRPIRGGRGTSSGASVGRGLSASPEIPLFDMSTSPSVYMSSSPSIYMSSSPSPNDSFLGSRGGPGTSHSPQQGAEQHNASPQSHVGEGGSSFEEPIWGSVDPANGLIWLCPVGTTEFLPNNDANSIISNQIFRNYNLPYGSWTEIPQDNRDAWFNEFLKKFNTLPKHHEALKAAYNFRAGKWLNERFFKLRRGRGKKDWIQPEVADQLLQHWASDEKFQNKSQKNKQNRAKMEGPSYAGGCISLSEHKRKIALSEDVAPEDLDWIAFERTHSQQSEGSEPRWINAKAQQVADNYKRLTEERDSQTASDPTSSQSDNESLFIQAAGGMNNKGRIFGFGASASRFKQTKRSSSGDEGVSADEMKKMKALVQAQAVELHETREIVRQMQGQTQELHETREMVRQMQLQLMFLMKNKGPASGDGDNIDGGDDNADDAAL